MRLSWLRMRLSRPRMRLSRLRMRLSRLITSQVQKWSRLILGALGLVLIRHSLFGIVIKLRLRNIVLILNQ